MTIQEADPRPSFCSFCAQPRGTTSRLVAGPGVAICSKCVERAASVLAESNHVVEDSKMVAPWEAMTDEQLLSHLPEVAAVAGHIETALSSWVHVARERSISWAKIGGSLGMTRQSAWERFHR
jgi:hypothetical protein